MTDNIRKTLICTVGTSLFGAFRQGSPPRDTGAMEDVWMAAKDAYERQYWPAMADALLKGNPALRMYGAEINSIQELYDRGIIEAERLFFLVSDTEEGRNVGAVLKRYFEGRKDLALKSVECLVVEKLQDESPANFRTKGLRNLVHRIGEVLRRTGGAEYAAIDATGGYKAQIAVAVIMGQVLDMPVFYKHERFSEIISFPPLPVSFDYEFIGRNADIFDRLKKGDTLSSLEIDELDERMKVFVDEIEVLGERMWELNAMGLIYLLGFQMDHRKVARLPGKASSRKEPTFGKDHHFPKGFKEFVNKVWRENKWISTIYSLPYNRQGTLLKTGFRVEPNNDEEWLVGYYVRDNFKVKFRVLLSEDSDSLDVLSLAASLLNDKYAD